MEEKRRFRPSRKLGQNFLIDTQVARRIVGAAAIEPGEPVIDIGAGTGALTRHLLEHPSNPRVTAVEIDKRLAEELERRFGDGSRFELVRADILRVPVDRLLPGAPAQGVVLTNAPYSISGALLRWLMQAAPRIDRIVAMFQEEVIERILAEPGNKTYAMLTVACRFHFRVERCFSVHAGAFRPRPRVESTVIRLIPHRTPPVAVVDSGLFMSVARAAFSQRRKTLRNSLRAGAKSLPGGAEAVDRALERAGIDPGLRAEMLDLDDYARLANGFG
ncbi:MAG: ribosomal RNA small subunit methyltransferase A [Gemmatimonadetes bacterium]|nr:ribosomal RNA small subunit methyltransferase A [Gemmatimonadota bacterium]